MPEAQRIPVDLRRTTLVVRDIDRSLPLYRDALGLTVIYDQVIGGTTRLVLLRANDDDDHRQQLAQKVGDRVTGEGDLS